MLDMSYSEHTVNVNVPARRHELILSTVRHHKVSWFGQVCRRDSCRASCYKEHWMVGFAEADRVHHEGQREPEWTGLPMLSLLHIVNDGSRWATITVEAPVRVPQ